jgi:Uma2 family endonuclease
MHDVVKYNATYADLEAVPPNLVAEILYGKLVTHPRPTGRHGRVHFKLGSVLGPPFGEALSGPGGWEFVTEPELHLKGGVSVPELAGWRIERMPAPPELDPLDPVEITMVPDWVCEVLSPSTEGYDRGDKRKIYAEAGVKHLWLVDPRIQILEIFALSAGRWMLVRTCAGDDEMRLEPFDAIEIRLGRIWPPSRQLPLATD